MDMFGKSQGAGGPNEKAMETILHSLSEMQIREEQRNFNDLSNDCFDKCITSFRSRNLSNEESRCIQSCADKFLNFHRRATTRFMEISMGQQSAS
eukprot:537972_1